MSNCSLQIFLLGYLGGDCNGLELGLIFPHPSSPLPPPPPPLSSFASSRNGNSFFFDNSIVTINEEGRFELWFYS